MFLDSMTYNLIFSTHSILNTLGKGQCENYQFLGDLYCDDVNNHIYCLYDGGDCCLGMNTATDYCEDCFCFYGKTLKLIF